jgi:hypothetical protein
MAEARFDSFTRHVATNRRLAIGSLIGLGLGAVGLSAPAQAQCVRRKNPCVGDTKEQRDLSCCSGCCRKGRCRAPGRCGL